MEASGSRPRLPDVHTCTNAALLAPAPRAAPPDRLLAVVAAIAHSDPAATLRGIAERLEAIREPTPRGHPRWRPGSVAHLLARARRAGLLPAAAAGGRYKSHV